jgi:hypothetical protein
MADKPKRSFFERLTGAVNMDNEEDVEHLSDNDAYAPSGPSVITTILGPSL